MLSFLGRRINRHDNLVLLVVALIVFMMTRFAPGESGPQPSLAMTQVLGQISIVCVANPRPERLVAHTVLAAGDGNCLHGKPGRVLFS